MGFDNFEFGACVAFNQKRKKIDYPGFINYICEIGLRLTNSESSSFFTLFSGKEGGGGEEEEGRPPAQAAKSSRKKRKRRWRKRGWLLERGRRKKGVG